MITFSSEQIRVDKFESVQCDVCRSTHDADDLESQAYLSISDVGGYGSVFGDMHTIELDMCQYCMMDLLGNYIRVGKPSEVEL